MTEHLKHIVESLLFVSESPLTEERIRRIVPDAESGEIRAALHALLAEYRERDGGFYLCEVAGGYQFRTRPRYHAYVRRMLKPNAPRLSKAALETLAVIAYRQPVIRSDVEHIRGVDCGGIIRTLMERKLIRILGRREIPGRPLIYATTKLFLEVFDLKTLRDLPTPKEIEEMEASPLELEIAALEAATSGADDDADPDAPADAEPAGDPPASEPPAAGNGPEPEKPASPAAAEPPEGPGGAGEAVEPGAVDGEKKLDA